MAPINLVRNHDEFINAVKLRLTKLEVTPVIYLLTVVCYRFIGFIKFSVNLHPTNREDLMKENSFWLVFNIIRMLNTIIYYL